MLEVQGINVFYGDSHIVRDVHFRVAEGQVVCLMGRNGVGKTTTLKTVMGTLKPRSGHIRFREQDVTKSPPYVRARMGIGYAPQGREIIPSLTVEENIRIGLRPLDGPIPGEIFTLFPVLKSMLNKRGGDLSGGQQQQLSIARALVSNPSLLILDEPTEGIQPSVIKEIAGVIQKLKNEGRIAILLVEQYLDFVRNIADQFYIMEKGSIATKGPISDLSQEVIQKHLTV